jgi:hypothetical protein
MSLTYEAEIERLARLICGALESGISPDSMVTCANFMQTRNGRFVIPEPMHQYPLWGAYCDAARAVYEDQHRDDLK